MAPYTLTLPATWPTVYLPTFHAAVFARLISLSLLFQGLTWKGLAGEHSRVQVPPCGMLFHWCYEQSKTLNVSGGT